MFIFYTRAPSVAMKYSQHFLWIRSTWASLNVENCILYRLWCALHSYPLCTLSFSENKYAYTRRQKTQPLCHKIYIQVVFFSVEILRKYSRARTNVGSYLNSIRHHDGIFSLFPIYHLYVTHCISSTNHRWCNIVATFEHNKYDVLCNVEDVT